MAQENLKPVHIPSCSLHHGLTSIEQLQESHPCSEQGSKSSARISRINDIQNEVLISTSKHHRHFRPIIRIMALSNKANTRTALRPPAKEKFALDASICLLDLR
jgi:hypothetical protein